MTDIKLHRWYGFIDGDSISMYWVDSMNEGTVGIISCEIYDFKSANPELRFFSGAVFTIEYFLWTRRICHDITDWFCSPVPVPAPDTHALDFVRVTAPHFFEAKNV